MITKTVTTKGKYLHKDGSLMANTSRSAQPIDHVVKPLWAKALVNYNKLAINQNLKLCHKGEEYVSKIF
jgi:hypothetical protein